MIRVTRLDRSEMFLNEDLIESIEETPDTHITLTNGKRYLVRESASAIIEQIVRFRTRIITRAQRGDGGRYLRKGLAGCFRPVFNSSDMETDT
jgi:flagellar protein FlbD